MSSCITNTFIIDVLNQHFADQPLLLATGFQQNFILTCFVEFRFIRPIQLLTKLTAQISP